VVTVRLVDAEADRLPRVGHTRSETSCAVVPLRPLWQHAARWPFQNPAKRCRGEVSIWLFPPDRHDRGFSLAGRFSLFLPFSTSIPLHVTRRAGSSAARTERRQV